MDVNTFKEAPIISGFVTGIISTVVIRYVYNNNIGLALLAGFLIGGFVYLFYNDFEQKKQIAKIDGQKEEARKMNIHDQRTKDLEKQVCISCNKAVNSQDKACASCGFSLEKITME